MTVGIVTESTADIPDSLATELGIAVVPSYVVFGTETYRDGIELSREAFYEKLGETRIIPTTATPPPDVYEEVYHRLAQETDEIVSIHLASNLSALFGVASVAAKRISEVRVTVLDSQQVTMGCGWMAVAAAQAAQRGESQAQIVQLVEGMIDRTRVFAMLDTLEYIYRGGRVGWVQALLGTMMRVKPIIQVYQGQVELLERARTRKRSLNRLVQRVQACGPLERAIVLHTNAPSLAEHLADKVRAIVPGWERLIAPAGVTIASHVGPGGVGIACVAAE